MSSLFDTLSTQARGRLEKRTQPEWMEPMLATLTHEEFSDPEWIYERKLDGVRCLVFRAGSRVRILSRNNKSMNPTWPELVEELLRNRCDSFVADGEIVAFEGNRTSFARLQKRIGLESPEAARQRHVAVSLYLFDLLWLRGYDITKLAQRERKQLLKRALSFGGHIHFTPHRNQHGLRYLKQACRKRWEGLIAKRDNAPYSHGRSRDWLKFKCGMRQELVIGGFTEPKGKRRGFGALLVGTYENGALRYAGKVGTGYDNELLESLSDRLQGMQSARSPFAGKISERGVHFVKPRLVGEFGFTEWTRDGKLRHPRFLGLRTDKKPRDVHRERPSG